MAILYGAAIFVMGFLTDVVWARWTMAATAKQANRAAAYAVLIVAFSLLGWDAYHRSYWYVLPYAMGCGIGTRWAVAKEK